MVGVGSAHLYCSVIAKKSMRSLLAVLALLALLGAALAQSAPPGTVLLDSYPGTTDDDKLTAALADVKTKTYIPAIMLSGRTYTFTKTQTSFSGLKIVGPPTGYQNSELSNGHYNSVKVILNVGTGANSWFVGTATTYNIYIARIGFASSNANSQFWHHPLSAGTIYASTFETLGFFGFKYVFGTPTDKCALTQVNFVGQWTVGPGYGTAFTVGGSDNELWTSGYLNIFPGAGSSFAGAGQYLLSLSYLSKTNVGPVYATADNGWSGIYVEGSDSYGTALSITGARFEGSNKDSPSYGALVTQNGGKVIWRDVWVGYGMSNPTANGHSPTDQGMIMHLGGIALWDGLTYDRATGVSQSVPLIWANAGTVRVRNVFTASGGGAWTALPIVKQGGSATFVIDDTVTQA